MEIGLGKLLQKYTKPDTTVELALPLIVLYELSLILGKVW
tara:strand:+ start:324 stop:443 length:120 start_codon:yes stop_codon:yes gene_type:complete